MPYAGIFIRVKIIRNVVKMKKIDKKIEIVRSSIIRLSSMSEVSARAVQAVLSEHYSDVSITTVNTVADLDEVIARQPDLVFLGLKYIFDESHGASILWVSEYLDAHSITYTGSSYLSHILEADKSLAKAQVHSAGFKTALFQVVKMSDSFSGTKLTYPLFVKPTDRGGGVGIDSKSIVHNDMELRAKITMIRESLGADVLIEEYLSGREFSVALLRDNKTDLFAMPIELVASADLQGNRILSHAVKSENTEVVSSLADLSLKKLISDLAVGVFTALGARDYGRVDIRLDQYGVPHFLEANLIPSLIRNYGSFPKACQLNEGIEYESMILSITNASMSRV